LLKLLLVAVMGGLGGINWWQVHRGTGSAARPWAVMEALVALGVVAVTGLLGESAHP
jgi:hypothetical protein